MKQHLKIHDFGDYQISDSYVTHIQHELELTLELHSQLSDTVGSADPSVLYLSICMALPP